MQAERLETLGFVAQVGLKAGFGGGHRRTALHPLLLLSVHVDLQDSSSSERDPHAQPGLAVRRRSLPVELNRLAVHDRQHVLQAR